MYNPIEDQLQFGVYQQHFHTWWFDSDGDKHDLGKIYANLRFFETGEVFGIRSNTIPRFDQPDTYTMKGNWSSDKNYIEFNLKKTAQIDDRITMNISESEYRNMKYHGKIADDNSLIAAGNFKGTIRANTIVIDQFSFFKLSVSKLIVTASEDTCQKLEEIVKNHPRIIDTFQDSGNWYVNGETGPEWFTVHIEIPEDFKTEIEQYLRDELKKLGILSPRLFWS